MQDGTMLVFLKQSTPLPARLKQNVTAELALSLLIKLCYCKSALCFYKSTLEKLPKPKTYIPKPKYKSQKSPIQSNLILLQLLFEPGKLPQK